MKKLRFLAILLAFGFVTYHIIGLNNDLHEKAVLSSLIEVYVVNTEGELNLRSAPSINASIVTKLNGKNSGEPDTLLVISKSDPKWWKVQLTDQDENNVVVGYVAKEFLKLEESIHSFSLFWKESELKFDESLTNSCTLKNVEFENAELVVFDLRSDVFKNVEIQKAGESSRVQLYSGALLKVTETEGEYEILSNPSPDENDGWSALNGAVAAINGDDVSTVEDKVIRIAGLEEHIRDTSVLAKTFELKNEDGLLKVYNCCFEGLACQDYAKLKSREAAHDEVLMLPFKPVSVFRKLQASSTKYEEAAGEDTPEEAAASESESGSLSGSSESRTYTNYEDYFLGPKGVDGRRGGDVYRLNVKSGGGLPLNGPCGSYHYNPERMGGLIGGDRYIKKEVLSCFLGTLQEFRKKHPDANVQWGDIARGDMTDFYNLRGTQLDHSSHKEGRDIDVRPVRADDSLVGCNIKRNPRCMSRELTQSFIDIAIKFGGVPIYFNDNKIIRSSSKIEYMKKHYDHFHIRYGTKACKDVVLDTKYCPTEGFN